MRKEYTSAHQRPAAYHFQRGKQSYQPFLQHKRSCYLKSITFHSTKQLFQGQSDGELTQISQLVMTSFGIRITILSH